MKLLLTGALLFISFSSCFGAVCNLNAIPTILETSDSELHQVWQLKNNDALWTTTVPTNKVFKAYQENIQNILNVNSIFLLERQYLIYSNHNNPQYQLESKNFKVVLDNIAGRISKIRCIEAIMLSTQMQRYPMATHPTEFSVSILKKIIYDESYLRIYFSASDKPFPPVRFDFFEDDLQNGWTFYAHLHNHPFILEKFPDGDYQGGTVPSANDIHLYRAISKRLGLQNAWITNGFDTIYIKASELNLFYGN